MTIEVELPDGSVVEFPDGTSQDVMRSAVQRHVGATAKKPVAPAIPMQGDQYSPAGEFVNQVGRRGTDFSTDMSNMAAGFGEKHDRLMDGLTQLYLQLSGDEKAQSGLKEIINEKRRLDKPLVNTTGGQTGAFAHDVAMTAVPASRLGKLTSVLPSATRAAARIGGSAALGGAYEAAQPVDEDETRAGNALGGAATGALGQAAGNVVGRVIRGPLKLSRQAQALPPQVRDAATIGQVVDRNTISGRIASSGEEALTSVPVVGSVLRNARQRGMDTWRDDVVRRAAPEGFVPPSTANAPMRGSIDAIQDEFAKRYGNALSGQQIAPSRAFESRVLSDTSDPMAGLTQAQQEEIRTMTMNYYQKMFSGKPGAQGATPMQATAEQAKEFERFLTAQARQYRRSDAPQAQNMAGMYDKLESAWTSAYRSQLPLSVRQQLRPLDQQYAPFKTVERASTAVGNEEGNFTPSQLLNSVKARSTRSEFARGDGMLQDAADNGKAVFGDKLANSGTTDRAATGVALGAALMNPMAAIPTATAGWAGAKALTSKPVKRFMTGQTKTQMLLQRMRADAAAESMNTGLGTGLAIEDYLE